MNLRDKLKAVSAQPKARVATEKPPADCCHVLHVHPYAAFPDLNAISARDMALMQGQPLPEDLSPRRILYLDTETTGFISTGTVAFLVGLGYMGENGLEVHQYLMRDYPEERALLQTVSNWLHMCDAVCTFNGRSFDLPMLRNRFIMNRLPTAVLDKPHIDLMHIVRRVYRLRLGRCSLSTMEERLLGQGRDHDLSGAEAPKRYFAYLKSGDFSLLEEVLSHNEQDVASLCSLLGHLCRSYHEPETLRHAEDLYAMGIALDRMNHPEEARRCYRLVSGSRLRSASHLSLARSYQRSGQTDEAVQVLQEMAAHKEGGIEPLIALAKHYEHQTREYGKALDCTRAAIQMLSEPTLIPRSQTETLEALRKRQERLKRKLKNQGKTIR